MSPLISGWNHRVFLSAFQPWIFFTIVSYGFHPCPIVFPSFLQLFPGCLLDFPMFSYAVFSRAWLSRTAFLQKNIRSPFLQPFCGLSRFSIFFWPSPIAASGLGRMGFRSIENLVGESSGIFRSVAWDYDPSGWWFGTFGLFSQKYWVANHPNWLPYFSEGWLNHQPAMIIGMMIHDSPIDSPHSGISDGWCWMMEMMDPHVRWFYVMFFLHLSHSSCRYSYGYTYHFGYSYHM